jgi:hypothetical protein
VATATTDIDGYYQANITGFKPPMVASISYIDATGATVTRYSPSVSSLQTNGFITINITGLTTYLAAQVAIAAGSGGAQDLTPAMLAAQTATLAAETTKLRDFLTANLTDALKTEIAGYGLNLATFDPVGSQYIPSVKSGYDTILENVSATTPASIPTVLALKSPLELAKSMFAELRTSWGTALAPASTTINDFLITQTAQTTTDVNSVVQPNLTKVQSRFTALMQSMQFFDDGKAYTGTSTFGMVSGTDPIGAAPSLIRTAGLVSDVWAGTGYFMYCWTDAASGITTNARCFSAGASSADIPNNRIKGVLFQLTSTGTNAYSYTATRYNWAVTGGGTAVTGVPSLVTTDTVGNTMPTGSGTVSKATSGTTITSLTVNGSFPPSATLNGLGQVLTTGVDNVVVNSVRTALAAANTYHYTLNGTISTSKLAAGTTGAVDSSKLVTMSFDTGSYFDLDESNLVTGKKALIAKIIGTVQTLATKFTGTFDLSAPSADADGLNYSATHVVFNGGMSNLTGANVGQILTGKVDVVVNNYNLYHSTTGDTLTNYAQGVATFTGTLQAPLRPLMTVTTTLTKTGPTTSTATMKYSYGLDVEVNGTTSVDTASLNKPVLTLTNQNGVQIVLDTTTYTGPVTVPGVSGTTVWGNISAGVVNYSDGVTESFN